MGRSCCELSLTHTGQYHCLIRGEILRVFNHPATTSTTDPLINKAIINKGLRTHSLLLEATISTVEVTKLCGFPMEHVCTTASWTHEQTVDLPNLTHYDLCLNSLIYRETTL